MRTLVLVLLALGVFLGGYFVVAWLMPDPQAPPRKEVRAVPTVPHPSSRVIGDIDDVTLRTHDPKTGAPVAEVRIGEYRRSGEHQVLLREIEATILLEEGAGVVTLSAPTGTVDLEAEVQHQDRLTAEALGTADVARLRDVTIRWYDKAASAAKGPAAALLTLRVDNLVYDNNRFSLFTDDTEIAGATVLADDVPIEVRGRDYDFDGRGLLVRWDAQTRRPTMLRVARGERLTIKTQRGFMPTRIVGGRPRNPWPGGMLASAHPGAIANVLSQAQPIQVYRATMNQNLRAQQGGLTKLEADTATVLFATDSISREDGEPESQPPAQTRPAPTTQTRPAAESFVPITLFWDGQLLIEATDESAAASLQSPQDMRLHLVGAPLIMREEGVEARALELDYGKAADELLLTGDDSTPVTLVDAEGSTLVTSRLLAHPNVGTARAVEAGYADVVTGDAEALELRWNRECDFVFEEKVGGGQQLKSVEARGEVAVRHPDVSLDAEELDVSLEPSADDSGDPQLRKVVAKQGVRCEITQQGQESTSFTSDRLTLALPEGMKGPITALAEGNVNSDQHGQALRAGQLRATLKPGEDEDLRLVELLASGDVQGSDVEGRKYSADVLRASPLEAEDGQEAEDVEQNLHIRLEGAGEKVASVEVGQDRLAAPVIEFNSRNETVHVPGAGQMHTVQQGPSGRPLPVVVSWADSMDGGRDEVTINGQVQLKGTESPTQENLVATTIDVQAGSAVLKLAEEVPEQAGDPQVARAATTRPADLAGDLQQVTLSGGLRATMQEHQDEALLRSFDLRAEALDAWPRQDTTRLLIESPGRVLFRDLRPPVVASGPTTRPTAEGFRGNAAVDWAQRLSFEPETGVLLLSGGVNLAVEPLVEDATGNAANARSFRLDADEVRVQTEQTADGRLEMKSVTAAGQARFETDGLSFEAGEVVFDPVSQRITARGAGGTAVVVFDADGVPTGRFTELIYNLGTGQIERLRDLGAGG